MILPFQLPSADDINPARPREVKQYRHDRPLLSCRFDPTGRFLFTTAQDYLIQRWNLENDQQTTLTGHESWVKALAFIRNTNKLVSGAYDGKLIWWQADASNPQPERTIEAHDGWVRAVDVSPNNQLIASCGNDNLVKLWSANNGSEVRVIRGHDCHVYNLAFHPSGEFLVSADHKGVVKQWEVSSGREVRTLDAGFLHRYDTTFRAIIGGIRGIAFNDNGSFLACGGITDVTNAFAGVGNPAIALFNWENGERRILRPAQAFRGTVWGTQFHPQGFLMAAGGGQGGAMWSWRTNQDQAFATSTLPNNARDMHLHPDGFRIAIPFYDRIARIYDMRIDL